MKYEKSFIAIGLVALLLAVARTRWFPEHTRERIS